MSNLACANHFSSDLSRTRRLDQDASDRRVEDDLLRCACSIFELAPESKRAQAYNKLIEELGL